MAKHILSKEDAIKLIEEKTKRKNGPRWFLLSYDAGEEIRKEMINEKKEKQIIKYRKYANDDFRKVIIRALYGKAKVVEMEEPVETSILFLDPRSNMSYEDKLLFWEAVFEEFQSDFYYIIAPLIQYTSGVAIYAERPNRTLNANFQKLVKEVLPPKKP